MRVTLQEPPWEVAPVVPRGVRAPHEFQEVFDFLERNAGRWVLVEGAPGDSWGRTGGIRVENAVRARYARSVRASCRDPYTRVYLLLEQGWGSGRARDAPRGGQPVRPPEGGDGGGEGGSGLAGVTDLGEFKTGTGRHLTGPAQCLACGHGWVAVAPVGVCWLECPSCGTYRGTWSGVVGYGSPVEVFRCGCGCEAIRAFLVDGGPRLVCCSCGVEHRF